MAALRGARNLFSQANHLKLLRVHPVALGDTSVNLKCVLEVFSGYAIVKPGRCSPKSNIRSEPS